MAFSCADMAEKVAQLLTDEGYRVHSGDLAADQVVDTCEGPDWWFTWTDPGGRCDVETGGTNSNETAAWADALTHYITNSEIKLHTFEAPLRPIDENRLDRFVVIAWPQDHEEELSDYARDIQSTLDYAQSGGARVFSVLPDSVEHALNDAEGDMA
jgi:hypothetical protein